MKLKLAMKADDFSINSTRWSGWTLLHRAAELGNNDICQLLLDNGASVDIKSTWGWHTALHLALGNGWLETALLLTEHGANQYSKNKYKQTPAAYGMRRGYHTCVREFNAEQLRRHIASGIYNDC